MKYRSEIDGLRALAIVPVVLFHAGFQGFAGGFVGVDIFFVISGYLITKILMSELAEGRFSFLGFYERRARRILPALFLVLAVTVPFAYRLLSPSDLVSFAKSLLGSVVFLANVVSYQQSGYFDAASEIKPLMHLWSLAIEEQYYLFFPIALLFLKKLSKAKVFVVLFLVACVSLVAAQYTLPKNQSLAFFYLHTRAWELLVGALVSLLVLKPPFINPARPFIRTSQQALALVGLGLIVFSMLTFDKTTPFPGANALLPTLGCALVLLFATAQTWVGRLLSLKPFVQIGLISYSAYLWHQPIFAITRNTVPDRLGTPTMVFLIALTFCLAFLSWRFVEVPFRTKRVGRKSLAYFSIVGILFFAAVATWMHIKHGFPERFPAQFSSAFDPFKVKEGKYCSFNKTTGYEDIEVCEFGDREGGRTALLIGDSHASSLLGELDEAYKRQGVKGLRLGLLNCKHTIPGMIAGHVTQATITEAKQCQENLAHVVSFLKTNADAVVVSVRWTSKLYPIAGLIDDYVYDNGEGGVEFKDPSPSYAASTHGTWSLGPDDKKRAVIQFLSALLETGKKVFVVYPIPEVGWDLPRYNFATYLKEGTVKSDISTSRAKYKERNQFILETLDDPALDRLIRVKPEKIFCQYQDGSRCMAQVSLEPFYYDSNHLSSAGARPIALEIGRQLKSSTP